MTAHNLQALRVQDPVLTNLAQGYHNLELVGEVLMPTVEIDKEAGKIPKFGRLAFRLPSTVRNLRGTSNRLDPDWKNTMWNTPSTTAKKTKQFSLSVNLP